MELPPQRPSAPLVSGLFVASLRVSWAAPANGGRPPISDYDVRYRKVGVSSWTSHPFDGAGLSSEVTGLERGAAYEAQVRARNADGVGDWSASGTGTTPENRPPAFASSAPLAFSLAENQTGVVGDPVTATDADGDPLAYRLSGAEAAFAIDGNSGQVSVGTALDYEQAALHTFTVHADDGHGGTASRVVNVTVTDVAERPLAPSAPLVSGLFVASLRLSWAAPANGGRPAISDYDVRYRKVGTSSWTSHPFDGVGLSTEVTGLERGAAYEAQVRARNADGAGDWSTSGSGATPENRPPAFASSTPLALSLAENQTGVVGDPVTATDADGDPLTYRLSGAEAAFAIDGDSAQVSVGTALDYEQGSLRTFTVHADDGHGGTASRVVNVTVVDVAERPLAPSAPLVSALSASSLRLSWAAPANGGRPVISDYDVQYRKVGASSWTSHPFDGAGLSSEVTGLEQGAAYEAQVRAGNADGASDWSASGTGTPVELVADLLVDTNRDGQVDASDEEGEGVWTQASGAVFGPNQDDDDEDGVRDWLDAVVNGEADLLDMAPVVVRRMSWLSENHSVVIEMSSGVMDFEKKSVRPALFLQRADSSFEVLIDSGNGSRRATLPVAALKAGDVRLYLESALGRASGFDGNVKLVLKVEDGGGVVARDEVALRGSPILLSHHLQSAERLFVVEDSESFHQNGAFVGALETGLPDYADLYKINGATYERDRWAQDFMQTGYVQRPSPTGVKTDVVHVKLNRGGKIAHFLPDEYLGPDAGVVYPSRHIFTYASASYGGNLEIIPPHTHNGRHYPFGRVVIGGGHRHSMERKQVDFINAQEAQGPIFEVRSDWLQVGHIDEIFLVVPNLGAGPDERPWAIVIASPSLAIAALQAAQEAGHGSAKVFEGRKSYGYETTVDKLLSRSALMDSNDYAQGIIDTVREKLKSEVGLTDADFHEVPVLYHEWFHLALSPGIQNLVVADTVLFAPDPEGPDVDGVDVWQQATLDALDGLGLDIEFVDVFYSYHFLWGEAHCGTNVERAGVTETPWWTLDGEE